MSIVTMHIIGICFLVILITVLLILFLRDQKPIKVFKEGNETGKSPCDFRKGEVYKMNPASRSHVKTPYYVAIEEVGTFHIVTYIPKHHSLKIYFQSFEWNYHIPRMEYIGKDNIAHNKLNNQTNLLPNI